MSIQNIIKLYPRHSEVEKIRLVTPFTLIDAQKLPKLRVDGTGRLCSTSFWPCGSCLSTWSVAQKRSANWRKAPKNKSRRYHVDPISAIILTYWMFLGCTLLPKMESIWRIRTARAKPLMWLRERRCTSERTLGPVLCYLSPERQTRPAGNDQQGAARQVSSRREGLDVWALPSDPFSNNLSYPGINKSANSHVSPVHGCSWLRSWSNLCGRSLVDTWDLFSISWPYRMVPSYVNVGL
jgi:hypothetical protein